MIITISAALTAASDAAAKLLPHWWVKQAMCIHRHESLDWHSVNDWLGRRSWYHGGMQIDVRTWSRYTLSAYPRDPAAATPHEQLVVAYRIWTANGHRFGGGAWPVSSVTCGVR